MKKLVAILLSIVLTVSLCSFGLTASADVNYVAAIKYTENDVVYTDYYETLGDAIDFSLPGDRIYVIDDCSLSVSKTINSNVTLIIPTSDDLDDTFDGAHNASGAIDTQNTVPYVTLTIPNGVTLTVNGTLLVAGDQQSTQPDSGCLSGPYGMLTLNGALVVNGSLYARGIIDGSGTVTANSGAAVYQLFQLRDWRGGTATKAANDQNIFPFNRYEFNNIRTTAVYANGAEMFGQFYFHFSKTIFNYTFTADPTGNIPLIGDNGILAFSNSSGTGNITTTYDTATEKIKATVNDAIQSGDMSVTINALGQTYSIDSASAVLPFGFNADVDISNAGSLEIVNNVKLLPGCNMTVKNGGSLTIANGKNLYVYAGDDYSSAFSYNGNWTIPGDATLTVETGATVNYNGSYGGLATSDSTGGNLNGITWPANPGTTTVYEYANNTTATGVTFYYA